MQLKRFFYTNIPIYDSSFRKSGESGCLRLIRTTSKAFSCGGDEKNGAYSSFNVYIKPFLREKHMSSVPIQRFRGNRFNILFTNAAAVYFLIPKIKEFLIYNDTNRLLKSVKFDMNNPEFVAGCKALGLIAFLITTPLWCTIEDKLLHILDACPYYEEIITYLEECSNDVENFMSGNNKLSFCDEMSLASNEIYQALIAPSEYDNLVASVLKIVLPGICKVCKTLFKDFIGDGHWKSVRENDQMRLKTASVPKHNKFSETIFGHLDRILREKPNVSMIANEAYVMFVHNKTLQWLQEKCGQEKSSLLKNARKDVKEARKKFRDRVLEIERQRRLILEQKEKEREAAEKKRLKRLEEYTNSIFLWGLWQSEEQVEFHLNTVIKSSKDKTEALKAQLNFRHFVLQQKIKDDPKIYNITRLEGNKRVSLKPDELAVSVKKLINASFVAVQSNSNDDSEEDIPFLVGRRIKMFFENDTDGTVRTAWEGHVISTVCICVCPRFIFSSGSI